jgi:fused signal recognition particle receptor
MPEGIGPELLIVLFLVLLVAGIMFLSRRGPRGIEAPPPERAEPQPKTTDETEVTPEAETPVVVEPKLVEPSPETKAVARPSLRERLARSRRFLGDKLNDAFGLEADDETWEDLEAALIQADVGVTTATKVTESLREAARSRRVTDAAELRALLADELIQLFDPNAQRALTFADEGTTVWLVIGVNGTGKTTTIGKLAMDLSNHDRTVALAAADTFRAAADEQLGIWADRAGATLVKHQPGADPGAVAFDAFKLARARELDVLIVDTAGRLHTKTPLMDELGKVRRVIEKEGKVDEALLVIDATAGQNGLVQAREFAEAAGVTGVVLTKLDGSAKGGIALAIEDSLGIPIKLIGVGESVEDLEPFDPKTFIDALLS